MIRKNYIPTININPILNNNFNSKATLKITREIEKACVEVGFFQIIGHGIKLKQINKNEINQDFSHNCGRIVNCSL